MLIVGEPVVRIFFKEHWNVPRLLHNTLLCLSAGEMAPVRGQRGALSANLCFLSLLSLMQPQCNSFSDTYFSISLLLRVRSMNQQPHLGACLKGKMQAPPPDLLNQNLCFLKILVHSITVVPIFPLCPPLASPLPHSQSIPTPLSMSMGHSYMFFD